MECDLRDVFQTVTGDACAAEVLSLDMAGDGFCIMLGFVRSVVIIDIIGAKAIKRHVRSPAVVPNLEFIA